MKKGLINEAFRLQQLAGILKESDGLNMTQRYYNQDDKDSGSGEFAQNSSKFNIGDELETYGSEEPVVVVDMKANLRDALRDTENPKAVLSLEKAILQDLVDYNQKNKPWYLVRFKEGQPDSDIKYWAEDELQKANDSLREKSNINEAFRLQQLAGIAPINELNEAVGREFIQITRASMNEFDDIAIVQIPGDADAYIRGIYDSHIESITNGGKENLDHVKEFCSFYEKEDGIYTMTLGSAEGEDFIATDLPSVRSFIKQHNFNSAEDLVDEMLEDDSNELVFEFLDEILGY